MSSYYLFYIYIKKLRWGINIKQFPKFFCQFSSSKLHCICSTAVCIHVVCFLSLWTIVLLIIGWNSVVVSLTDSQSGGTGFDTWRALYISGLTKFVILLGPANCYQLRLGLMDLYLRFYTLVCRIMVKLFGMM